MKEDSVVEYRNPGIALPVADALTEVLRNGARELLQQAVEAAKSKRIIGVPKHSELEPALLLVKGDGNYAQNAASSHRKPLGIGISWL